MSVQLNAGQLAVCVCVACEGGGQDRPNTGSLSMVVGRGDRGG